MAQATTRLAHTTANGDDKIGSFSCIFIYIFARIRRLLPALSHELSIRLCLCVCCSLAVVLVHLYLPFHAYEPRRPSVHLCNIVRLLRHDRYMNMLFRCVSRSRQTQMVARARASTKEIGMEEDGIVFISSLIHT